MNYENYRTESLLKKISDTEDRRKHYICLTEDGEKIMGEAFACIEERFQQLIHHTSKKDLEDISYALNILDEKVFNPKS